MSNRVLLKKSSVSAKVPLSTDLEYGEVALNYQDGKLYFKTAGNNVEHFDSRTIVAQKKQEYTATASQTTFTVTGGYVLTTVQVFANGIALAYSDYTATNGTTVVLTDPRVAGDNIIIWFGGPASGGANGSFTQIDRKSYIATSGQTTFNVTYAGSYVDVYINGSHLNLLDYTATSGTNIVLNSGATVNDEIDLVGYYGTVVSSSVINNGDVLIYNGTTKIWDSLAPSAITTASAAKWSTARTLSYTGDATGSMSVDGSTNVSAALTLATVNSNVGSFGSTTASPIITVNAKGLVTAVSTSTITPAIGSITGLGTNVATALGVNTGTAGAFVVSGDALGTPASGVMTNVTGTAAGLTAGNVTTNANLTGVITSTGNATAIADAALSIAKTSGLQAAIDLKQNLSSKDAANGYAGLDGSSKINPSQLPALAITDTFVVASQAAQIALTAEVGDVAIRTDLSKSFILQTSPSSTFANWQELLTPTDSVSSVFGRTGVVTAQNGDYTAAQVGAPAGSGNSTGTNTGDQTNISGNAATVTTNANLTGPVTSVGNATSFTSGMTIPAFTLGGTVSGGGNQINNVVIGTTTPLAGAFTTLSATSSVHARGFDVPASGVGAELGYSSPNVFLRGYDRTNSVYKNLTLNDNISIVGGSAGQVSMGALSVTGTTTFGGDVTTTLGKFYVVNTYGYYFGGSGNLTGFTGSNGTGIITLSTYGTTRATFDTSGVAVTGALSTTGVGTFSSAASASSGSVMIQNADPTLRFVVSGGTADKSKYEWRAIAAGAGADYFQLRKINDASTVFTELLSIDNTGVVTIPQTLSVTGAATTGGFTSTASGTAASPSIQVYGGGEMGFYRVASNQLGIAAGGVLAATVSSTGVAVTGFLNATKSGGTVSTLTQTSATGYGLVIVPGADTVYDAFTINNAANTLNKIRMFGDGSATFAGNVGIGTTSPGYRLEVVGTDGTAGATSTVLRLLGNIGGVNKSGGLFFRTLNSTTTGTERIAIIQSADVDNNTRILALNPTGGDVGIGTTNPTAKLQVNNAADSRIIIYETGTTPYTATLELASQGIGTYGALLQYTSSAETLTLKAYGRTAAGTTQGSILFNTKVANTTDTTVMTIHGFSGNVGVGTSSPSAKLHLISNDADDSGGVRLERTSGTTGRYNQYISSTGDLTFTETAVSPRITLQKTTGTVFIGNTTTNTNSSKLVVNGTISQTVDSTQYQVVDQSDIGTAPNEIPLNQYLGSMAYQNGDAYYNTGMPVGFRNRIINGDMRIDQRNAGAAVSLSSSYLYVLDRWRFWAVGGGAFTVQQSSVSPAGFTNSIVITQTTSHSPTGTNYSIFAQYIEGYNVADFGWGGSGATAVTLSFWVRSSLTGTFGGAVSNGTQARSYPFTYTISFADSWEYKTITIPGDTTGTWTKDNSASILLFWQLGVGATYLGIATGAWISSTYLGANGARQITETNGATLYITGVQLEKGTVATPFDVRPYGTELQLCQRYFQIVGGPGTEHFAPGVLGTNRINIVYNFKQTMRAAPSFTATSFGSAFSDLNIFNGASTFTITGSNENYMATNSASIGFTHGGSTTAGNAGYIYFNSTSGRVAFSAEL